MLFSKYIILSSVLSLSSFVFANDPNPKLPSEKQRQEMVLNLSREIQRLDGEGLIPRKNRPESGDRAMKSGRPAYLIELWESREHNG